VTILSYHVFDGRSWLADDEHTWSGDFHESACFLDPKLAQDIGEREAKDGRTVYVMGCLGWQS
jgi:hypothetical protein